jgi:dolichol-phosphate mannosyltransferase
LLVIKKFSLSTKAKVGLIYGHLIFAFFPFVVLTTDAACGIKVIRRSCFLRVPRFAGMHRFMATLVRYLGGTVVEMDVNHRPRAAGVAKYGIGNRIWKGLRDCMALRWLRTRVLRHRVKEEF